MVVGARIRKVGNSKGIILSSTILEHLDAKEKDRLEMELTKKGVVIKKNNGGKK